MSDYNGWSNYETWNVALWLGNDEGTSRYWDEQADELIAGCTPQTLDGAISELADRLEREMEEQAPDLGASCYADLLNAALGEVGWYEIAEHLIDAAKERVAQ